MYRSKVIFKVTVVLHVSIYFLNKNLCMKPSSIVNGTQNSCDSVPFPVENGCHNKTFKDLQGYLLQLCIRVHAK